MENSSGSEMLMVIIRIIIDKEMFITIRTSKTGAGRGITRKRTMTTTISDIALFKILFIIPQLYDLIWVYLLLSR